MQRVKIPENFTIMHDAFKAVWLRENLDSLSISQKTFLARVLGIIESDVELVKST